MDIYLKDHAEKFVYYVTAICYDIALPCAHMARLHDTLHYNTGFRPECGKRQQVHDSADTTTPAVHVANEHVTRVSGSEPCEFYLLPPDGPKSGVHMAWKVSQPAICCPAYAVHAYWRENRNAMSANVSSSTSIRRQFPT
jgi:hypothetical protein